MNNKVYDKAKWVALVGLPAVGGLYFSLSGIWHFPKPDEVVGTVTIIDTFLGIVLHIDNKNYDDGDLNVVTDSADGGTAVQVNANDHPGDYVDGQKLMLKVNKVST